jgi:hypothetical protein
MSGEPTPSDPDVRPPFWKHRYYYLALKIIVLVFAVAVALRLVSWLIVS